jgi:hypothetical protein
MLSLQLVDSVSGISNKSGTSALSNSDSTKTPVRTLTSTLHDKGIFAECRNWFHDSVFMSN